MHTDLADARDVVGRIVVLAQKAGRVVDEVEQPVEADGGAPDWGEVEISHSHILHLSNMDTRGAQRAAARWTLPIPEWAIGELDLGGLLLPSRGGTMIATAQYQ